MRSTFLVLLEGPNTGRCDKSYAAAPKRAFVTDSATALSAGKGIRDIYLTDDPQEADVLLTKAIVGCLEDEVPEIVSLDCTLERWRL